MLSFTSFIIHFLEKKLENYNLQMVKVMAMESQ